MNIFDMILTSFWLLHQKEASKKEAIGPGLYSVPDVLMIALLQDGNLQNNTYQYL